METTTCIYMGSIICSCKCLLLWTRLLSRLCLYWIDLGFLSCFCVVLSNILGSRLNCLFNLIWLSILLCWLCYLSRFSLCCVNMVWNSSIFLLLYGLLNFCFMVSVHFLIFLYRFSIFKGRCLLRVKLSFLSFLSLLFFSLLLNCTFLCGACLLVGNGSSWLLKLVNCLILAFWVVFWSKRCNFDFSFRFAPIHILVVLVCIATLIILVFLVHSLFPFRFTKNHISISCLNWLVIYGNFVIIWISNILLLLILLILMHLIVFLHFNNYNCAYLILTLNT